MLLLLLIRFEGSEDAALAYNKVRYLLIYKVRSV